MHENLVLLSDFDGTVVNIDTGVYVLSKFANGDWQELDRRLERGELSFEENIRKQYGMINHPKEEILRTVETAATIRPGFRAVLDRCKERRIEFKILSGGLDFCIEHILRKNNLEVDLVAPKSTFGSDGIKVEFPKVSDPTSFSFKDDTVRLYQRQGFNVAFVGDGYADYFALKAANLRFAIKDSVSARLCKARNVTYKEIVDFEPVLDLISS